MREARLRAASFARTRQGGTHAGALTRACMLPMQLRSDGDPVVYASKPGALASPDKAAKLAEMQDAAIAIMNAWEQVGGRGWRGARSAWLLQGCATHTAAGAVPPCSLPPSLACWDADADADGWLNRPQANGKRLTGHVHLRNDQLFAMELGQRLVDAAREMMPGLFSAAHVSNVELVIRQDNHNPFHQDKWSGAPMYSRVSGSLRQSLP